MTFDLGLCNDFSDVIDSTYGYCINCFLILNFFILGIGSKALGTFSGLIAKLPLSFVLEKH